MASPRATLSDPWMNAIRRGDFESAWRISDEVLRRRRLADTDCSRWPRHLQFVWNGDPFDGRHVLVRCYHGLGDTIQFARFLAPLRARAALVTLWTQPPLITLLSSVAGVDAVLPLHDGAPDVDRDIDMELMELPHALRVGRRDLPAGVPYIGAAGSRRIAPRARLHVGLIWRSGAWDPRRSISPELLKPLQRIGHVRWYSLQYPREDLPFEARNLACRDIAKMASRMHGLDLIVTVDTMTAHLAGAMGLRVWTLLPYEADWRWFDDPARSIWYPTMRLLRQPAPGAWPQVIRRLAHVLRELLPPFEGSPRRHLRTFAPYVAR